MKQLLKSLIIPKEMSRFSYMSAIVSFVIFFLCYGLMQLPSNYSVGNYIDKQVARGVYDITILKEISENEEMIKNIKDGRYVVEKAEMTTVLKDKTKYSIYVFTNETSTQINYVYFIYDPFDILYKSVQNIYDIYIDKYDIDKNSGEDLINRGAYLSYIFHSKTVIDESLDYDALFEYYEGKSLENIIEEYNSISQFEYYGINPYRSDEDEKLKNCYLFCFNKNTFSYQTNIYNDQDEVSLEGTSSIVQYSSEVNYNFSDVKNAKDLGLKTETIFKKHLIAQEKVKQIVPNFFYLALYPLMAVIILKVFMGRRGYYKTFKEYYNIAGISAVFPFLISFIAGWFNINSNFLFASTFTLMYIFQIGYMSLRNKKGEIHENSNIDW